MIIRNFIRKTERNELQKFLKELESKVRIKYLSNIRLLSSISQDYTGVYISDNGQVISVFIETNKTGSIKTIVA